MFYLMFNQMKKKIFSPLLFMALTLAVSSLFVSCKDYDDDIDSLRLDQTDLLSKLTSLETSVNGQLSSLTASLSSVQTTANDALAKANQAGTDITKLQGSVSEVAKTAEEAGKAAAKAEALANGAQGSADKAQGSADAAANDAAAAKEAAAKAQKAADDAMAKANEAFQLAKTASDNSTAVSALTKAESALTQIGSINEQIGKLQAMTDQIPTLKSQIEKAATKEELGALKTTVEAYQKVFDTLFAMVTNIELVGSYNGTVTTFTNPDLTLYYGNVAATATFGDNEAYTAAAPLQAFVEGDAITPEQGVIIRVNPSNVDFSKFMLHVINSKGESLDDFITLTSLEPVGDMLLTRGTQLNSGLWKLNFALKADADLDAFERACYTDYTTNNGVHKQVLFAVALNNTVDNNSDRFVASSFELTMKKAAYTPANALSFTVNDKDVATLKNRVAANATKTYALAENRTVNNDVHEYTWKNTPYAAMSTSTVKQDLADARATTGDLLKVECGVPFTVKLQNPEAAYFYAVLDKDYAIESAPSEWNIWEDYAISGLNKVVKAGEDLNIIISDERAKSDIIGIRVFAVNCDGTLLDPDGKAFYVQVNNDVVSATVNAEVVARYGANKSQIAVEIPEAAFKASSINYSMTFDWEDFADLYKQQSKDGASINCRLLKSTEKNADGTWQFAKNWKDAKYVLVTLNQANLFEDGKTFKVVMTAEESSNTVAKKVNELVINVTKKMPTTAPYAVAFKTNQFDDKNGVFKAYLTPDNDDWKTQLTEKGHNVLTSAVNGLDDEFFTWEFADAARDKAKNVVAYKVGYGATGDYNIDIDREFVDNKTLHATICTYTYKNISLTRTNGEWNAPKDWVVNVESIDGKNTMFSCPIDISTYALVKDADGQIQYGAENKALASTKIKATNGYNNTLYGGTAWYKFVFDTDYMFNNIYVTKQVEAHLYSGTETKSVAAQAKKDEYFSVEIDRTNGLNFKFNQNSNSTNPINDVTSTLQIVIYDVFGHKNIIEVPKFVVKKQ